MFLWKLPGGAHAKSDLRRLRTRASSGQTFIGRIARGFDFLGYRFGDGRLRLAQQTVARHAAHWLRLYYEQQTKKKATPNEVARVLRTMRGVGASGEARVWP